MKLRMQYNLKSWFILAFVLAVVLTLVKHLTITTLVCNHYTNQYTFQGINEEIGTIVVNYVGGERTTYRWLDFRWDKHRFFTTIIRLPWTKVNNEPNMIQEHENVGWKFIKMKELNNRKFIEFKC